MAPPLPLIGAGEPLSTLLAMLEHADASVVLEDGKEQKVATFEEIQTPAGPLRRTSPQPNQFSNVVPGESSPTRLVMIVLDMINTPFEDQAYSKKQLLKYLGDTIDSSQPISLMVITRSGLKVVHDFTTDPQVLIAALKKASTVWFTFLN